jgi:hypothetical protein
MKEFCGRNGKYYDYTTTASVQAELDARDHYAQYAWHLRHSVFNFCWPVEVTNPGWAKMHSPITCRWFEAAASGNVILGRAPQDPEFDELFGEDAVIEIDHANGNVLSSCESLWAERDYYLERALERREKHSSKWSWEARIAEILKATGQAPAEGEEQSAKG